MTAEPALALRLRDGADPDGPAHLAALLGMLLGRGHPTAAPVCAVSALLGDRAFAPHVAALMQRDGLAAVQESQRFSHCQNLMPKAGDHVTLHQTHGDTSTHLNWRLDPCPQGNTPPAQLDTRLQFLSSQQVHTLRAPQFSDHMAKGTPTRHISVPITADHVLRYVMLTHDPNPLHQDRAAAQSVGFDDLVVPGMLLCALSEALFRDQTPSASITELRARFLSPAYVGAAVTLIQTPLQNGAARGFVLGEAGHIHAIVDIVTK